MLFISFFLCSSVAFNFEGSVAMDWVRTKKKKKKNRIKGAWILYNLLRIKSCFYSEKVVYFLLAYALQLQNFEGSDVMTELGKKKKEEDQDGVR